MKKFIYLIVLTLILGLVLNGCSLLTNVGQVPATEQSGITYLTKGTPGDHDVFTLYAGQNIDVGTVKVWNDSEILYVQYVVDDPWEVTCSHLYVGKTDPINFPSTPGQLPYSPGMKKSPSPNASYDDTTMTYTIPLDEIYEYEFVGKGQGKGLNAIGNQGVEPCDEIYIAAHAKVIRPSEDCWETVWQIGDVETNDCNNGVTLTNYADEFNWSVIGSLGYSSPTPCVRGDNLGIIEPPFDNPFIVGTDIDKFPYNSNESNGYAKDFDVKWTGALPFGGKLVLSWSPGKKGSPPEQKSITIDSLPTFTVGDSSVVVEANDGFMGEFFLVENEIKFGELLGNEHTINFVQTIGNGTFWDWIRLEKPCVQEESAWAVDEDAPHYFGKNWATYFDYTVEYNMVGTWIMDFVWKGAGYDRFIKVINQDDGVIDGYFGIDYPPASSNIYGTIVGTIDCQSVHMFYTNTVDPPYTAEFDGTMSEDGESVSAGTWTDSVGNDGTWTADRE